MISLSLLNPLRYTTLNYSNDYNTKYFDLFQYPDTLRNFEEQVKYLQPFCLDDPLVHQIIAATSGDMTIKFYDCDGNLQLNEALTSTFNITYPDGPGTVSLAVFNHTTDLNDLGAGIYYAQISDGTTTIQSNKFIVAETQPGTVQIKYRNYKRYQDVIFEKDTDFYFYLRVQGYVKRNLPKKSATTYEDQILNTTLLKYIPYNSWSYVTDSSGIPDYMSDLLNNAFGCSFLQIDGRLFTIPQEAEWEEKTEDFYPLTGYGIDMRETVINTSISYDDTTGEPVDPPVTIHDINSDWWTTTAGQHTIPLSAVGYKGIAVSQIYKLVMVSRSGNMYRVVDTTPVNDQVQLSGSLGIVFDSDLPFNSGETVTALFEVV